MARICIDPGHGQMDNLGLNGYREGTWMWSLGQYVQAALDARGHTVVNTRPNITDNPSLSARGACAVGCDLFAALHSNASSNPATRGASIYDSVADAKDVLETELVRVIADTMGTVNQGVRHRESTVAAGRDYYGVLRSAVMVACPDAMLIEHGYHTSPADCAWLMNHDNLRLLAEREADVITRYYGGTATIPTQEGTMAQIGTVQVTSHLNVRAAPSASAADIGDLGPQSPVLILATADGWHKIAWGQGVAYISAQYVAIQEYHEAQLPAPDYLATLNEMDEKIAFLTKEVFASQERYKEAERKLLLTEQDRDEKLTDLRTLSAIIKKYEV